jgi:TonB family protein
MMSQKTLLLVGILAVTGVACAARQMAPSPLKSDVAEGPIGPPVEIQGGGQGTGALPADQVPEVKEKKVSTEENEPDLMAGGEVAPPPPPPPPPHPISAAPRPIDPLAGPGGNPNARGDGSARESASGGSAGDSLLVEGGVYGGVVPSSKPKGVSATSEVRGSIDREEIRRVVMAHVNDVKHCYDQGLKRQPGLEGRVVLKFLIGKTGTVIGVTVPQTTLNDRQVEQCMVGAATKWTFPKPKGEGDVSFVYPFIFKSAS